MEQFAVLWILLDSKSHQPQTEGSGLMGVVVQHLGGSTEASDPSVRREVAVLGGRFGFNTFFPEIKLSQL